MRCGAPGKKFLYVSKLFHPLCFFCAKHDSQMRLCRYERGNLFVSFRALASYLHPKKVPRHPLARVAPESFARWPHKASPKHPSEGATPVAEQRRDHAITCATTWWHASFTCQQNAPKKFSIAKHGGTKRRGQRNTNKKAMLKTPKNIVGLHRFMWKTAYHKFCVKYVVVFHQDRSDAPNQIFWIWVEFCPIHVDGQRHQSWLWRNEGHQKQRLPKKI